MNKYNFQVGDYCYNRHHKKIIQLTPYDFFVHFHDKSTGAQYLEPILSHPSLLRDLEPIPITEEWLELNKIHLDETMTVEWEGMDDIKYWYSNDHRIQITNLSNTIYNGFSADVRMFRAHMDNEDYETIGCLDVQFVHQLQHLCRDCQYEFNPKFKQDDTRRKD